MTRIQRLSLVAVLVVSGGFTALAAPWGQQRVAAPPPKAKPPQQGAPQFPDAKTIEAHRVAAENRSLFHSEVPIVFTLTADFKAIDRERDPNSTKLFPATMEYVEENGTRTVLPLQVRLRGHSRREICSFPPLRLEFPKDQTKGTLFDGYGNIKLGVHCRGDFDDYVLAEYAVYKIDNLLTPRSFKARLGKATYVDAASKKILETRNAMFLEDDDDLAKRQSGLSVDTMGLTFNRVDLDTITMLTIFEYMIANTDVSMHAMHNVKVVQTPAGQRFVVPYDFDYSGVVNTPYAIPAKELGLTSVRDRLYRGPCKKTPAEFEPYFSKFREVKADIYAIYDRLPFTKPSDRADAKSFLEKFYRTIDRPSDVKHEFIDGCGNRPYF